MRCKNIQKKLIFLAERSLHQDEEKQILSHLESCAICREQYEFLKNVENLIVEKKSADVSPYFYTQISGKLQILETYDQPEIRPVWIKIANAGILTAIIVIALITGFILGQNESKYSKSAQNLNQQNNYQQNDITVTKDQFVNNFPTY
jgi:hypothetical protein